MSRCVQRKEKIEDSVQYVVAKGDFVNVLIIPLITCYHNHHHIPFSLAIIILAKTPKAQKQKHNYQ